MPRLPLRRRHTPCHIQGMYPCGGTAYVGEILQAQTQQNPALPVALLLILHTEFNGRLRQDLERRQRVLWPDFERLRRDLSTGNFRTDRIALPWAFNSKTPVVRAPPAGAPTTTTPPTTPTSPTRGEVKRNQTATQNPWPTAHLQVAPGFYILREINASAEEEVSIPGACDGRHFYLN